MKYMLLSSLVCFCLFTSCGKKEESKLQAYNAEAFAYDIGGSWEVNATTRVKGFYQKENNGIYTATLYYEIDLITANGDTLKSIISKTEDKTNHEKMSDVDLETQFELDSTYSDGTYKVLFNVRDVNSQQSAISSAEFIIENE